MKKLSLCLMTLILLFPLLSQAQNTPPPASWVEFNKEESAKRIAFMQQMKEDRDNFFSAHPEAKAYFEQLKAAAKERRDAWLATHQRLGTH